MSSAFVMILKIKLQNRASFTKYLKESCRLRCEEQFPSNISKSFFYKENINKISSFGSHRHGRVKDKDDISYNSHRNIIIFI